MGVQPEGVEGASGKPPPRLRRGETLCNIKGTTAQFVGSAGDAFSAICFLQKSRFTSSKPSISAIASDKKCIRHRTNSFVRYCLRFLLPRVYCSWQIFYAANAIWNFSIGVTTPRLCCTRWVL